MACIITLLPDPDSAGNAEQIARLDPERYVPDSVDRPVFGRNGDVEMTRFEHWQNPHRFLTEANENGPDQCWFGPRVLIG
ncbi:hypothetical protein N8D56_26920 (plasmid) [Devosia sp. A8/3-2]|nr:hypothetical protein N8D56_26920 [Devosia sp. A8/3-2]